MSSSSVKMEISSKDLKYLFHHIVLPPKLPHGQEKDFIRQDYVLLCYISDCALEFSQSCSPENKTAWANITSMFRTWRKTCTKLGPLNTPSLLEAILAMKTNDVLPINVRAQNAGLIIRRTEAEAIFECFEITHANFDVLACDGRLKCAYPHRVVATPLAHLSDKAFVTELATYIKYLEVETDSSVQASTRKAGVEVVEERGTVEITLVSDLLFPTICANGYPVIPQQIQKNIRDDVLWQNSKLPWRRSSLWLLLRVALQLNLQRSFPHCSKNEQYKTFMLYVMSKLGDLLCQNSADGDSIYAINTKLARRLAKLGSSNYHFVDMKVMEVLRLNNKCLRLKWLEIQKRNAVQVQPIEAQVTTDDTYLRLKTSSQSIVAAMKRSARNATTTFTLPTPQQRLKINPSTSLPTLESFQDDSQLALFDFEQWVETTAFEAWPPTTQLCKGIGNILKDYIYVAELRYQKHPEHMSIFFLTVLELWVVLDRLVTGIIPLMEDYSPEIPAGLLHPLLLPKLTQMRRLRKIEDYISSRLQRAKTSYPSHFCNPHSLSFGYKYFESSIELQAVLENVRKDANAKRRDKESEWQRLTAQYNKCQQEASITPHTCDEDDSTPRLYRPCKRCSLEMEYNTLSIKPHEWPLPSSKVDAGIAIFEIACPADYGIWRDVTWSILDDIGKRKLIKGPKCQETILGYNALCQWRSANGLRITLASGSKSFCVAHYRSRKLPTPLNDILLPNGFNWKLYDDTRNYWTATQEGAPCIENSCQTSLPSSPHSSLQYAVNSTAHLPNNIIAAQSKCHPELSIHEYVVFSSLRSGEQLQLLNILMALHGSDMPLNNESVCILICQALWQAGTDNGTDLRVSHAFFAEPAFVDRLLCRIEILTGDIQGNWKEEHSMRVLITLLNRILSVTSDFNDRASQQLRLVRSITIGWARDTARKLFDDHDEQEAFSMQERVLRLAIICRLTFDVEIGLLEKILASDDFAILIECASLIHDHNIICTPANSSLESLCRVILSDRRLSCRLSPLVIEMALQQPNLINMGIKEIWPEYKPGNPWIRVNQADGYWIKSETALTPMTKSQSVHFDCLSGQLLVDGHPVGKLPKSYTEHLDYRRIFGSRILHVVSSNMPEMVYMTARPINNSQLYFGQSSSNSRPIIRARQRNKLYEILPNDIFENDLPHLLVHDYCHWLEVETGNIEFRPMESIFNLPSSSWSLTFQNKTMRRGNERLVEFESRLGKSLSDAIQNLEGWRYLHMTIDDSGLVNMYLPRFELNFFVNSENNLESPDLSAVIDNDQSIGTMIGLQTRLVVRSKYAHPNIPLRSIIIPAKNAEVFKDGDHVKIILPLGSEKKVSYFRYKINSALGILQGPPNQHSRLLMAYLHALSSFVLVDPLINRSGTEEALRVLSENAIEPIYPFDEACVELLKTIGQLTPFRSFYPEGKRLMQEVEWNKNLSAFSQHENFVKRVNDLLSHSNQLLVLYQDSKQIEKLLPLEENLLARASSRNAVFRSHDLGGKVFGTDRPYVAADLVTTWNPKATNVYQMAASILSWSTKIKISGSWRSRLMGTNITGAVDCIGQLPPTSAMKIQPIVSWASLYTHCQSLSLGETRYKLQFFLASVSFGKSTSDMQLLWVLLACCISTRLRQEKFPNIRRYDFKKGCSLSKIMLVEGILDCYPSCPYGRRHVYERRDWHTQISSEASHFAEAILQQWPSMKPHLRENYLTWPKLNGTYFDEALTVCQDLFQSWNDNQTFSHHISRIEEGLKEFTSSSSLPKLPLIMTLPRVSSMTAARSLAPDLSEVLAITPGRRISPPQLPPLTRVRNGSCRQSSLFELEILQKGLSQSNDVTEKMYGENLDCSLQALQRLVPENISYTMSIDIQSLIDYRKECLQYATKLFDKIYDGSRGNNKAHEALNIAGLWPRLCPSSILSSLASSNPDREHFRYTNEYVLDYGIALTALQKADRMILLSLRGDTVGFAKEMDNLGHSNWAPAEYPDWLLIELEGNFMIRPIQVEVAMQMMSPSSGNRALQLNMGEGKSSVIMSLVASQLANGTNLARVVVPKPLLKAMSAILSERLGGLVNRRTFFTPFSRQTNCGADTLNCLRNLWDTCRTNRGVLLAQPEHILSFKLMGLERISAGHAAAKTFIEMERNLQAISRNLIDECDEILDPREQLIYTIGLQQSYDGAPDRWNLSLAVLGLLIVHLDSTSVQYRHKGCFPHFQFDLDTADQLLDALITDIDQCSLAGVLSYNTSKDHQHRQAALRFIRNLDADADDQACVLKNFSAPELNAILVLRGLIANNIIIHCLSKRWSVDYGLTGDRIPPSKVAVPYRAKGVPSRAAEFGHPEVMVIFTALSYYYQGLDESQIRTCFVLLNKSADPSLEYISWTKGCSCLPEAVRSLNGVNLDDKKQCQEDLFPHFRYNKAVIDFYISTIVFPKYCKEFPKKLATSAWDVPAQAGCPATTAFSGTNDSKYLLPLSITQRDLSSLEHTNGMVMNFLLQENNRKYVCSKSADGRRLDVTQLLQAICLQEPIVRVLIDVGAQVLEFNNKEVAVTWLASQVDADAAVYFDENDELMVVSRGGQIEHLNSSRFQDSLDRCLVYLDQSHTRGVDLKFAYDARAVVTLGPWLTKDRLVQGCMRMRKLNEGQSIVFFAPPEIDKDIRAVTKKSSDSVLDSRDVLEWSISQTIKTLKRNQPLWVIQGLNHSKRRLAETAFCERSLDEAIKDKDCVRAYLNVIEENDAHTLMQMYAPQKAEWEDSFQTLPNHKIIRELLEVGGALGLNKLRLSLADEEQEKEVAHEVERELQVQRPPFVEAEIHSLHKKVISFVKTGDIAVCVDRSVFTPAYQIFRQTSAGDRTLLPHQVYYIYATADFLRTVVAASSQKIDDYARPITFILSAHLDKHALVLISPYEANLLVPEIRKSKHVAMHLYMPKTTRSTPFVDDLQLYTVAGRKEILMSRLQPLLALNVMAGQLFFRNRDEYNEYLEYIRVHSGGAPKAAGEAKNDKEIIQINPTCLAFLKKIYNIRRKGQDISRTHVGRVLRGEMLTAKDFAD